jgi:hypothetical protein
MMHLKAYLEGGIQILYSTTKHKSATMNKNLVCHAVLQVNGAKFVVTSTTA